MQQPTVSSVRWEWIGEGWRAFAEIWGTWVLHSLVSFLIIFVSMIPFFTLLGLGGMLTGSSSDGRPQAPSPLIFLAMLVLYPILILVTAYLAAGFYKTAFKQLRGEPISIGDVFSGGDSFLRVTGTLLLVAILSFIGIFLCIIPAFIVQGLCFFALPLAVEKKLGPIAAIQASIEATRKDWLIYTLFAFVVSLIAGAGAILCYVGLLASYPLYFLITAVAYRQVFGLDGMRNNVSYIPPPPPNYGGYDPPPPPSSWQ